MVTVEWGWLWIKIKELHLHLNFSYFSHLTLITNHILNNWINIILKLDIQTNKTRQGKHLMNSNTIITLWLRDFLSSLQSEQLNNWWTHTIHPIPHNIYDATLEDGVIHRLLLHGNWSIHKNNRLVPWLPIFLIDISWNFALHVLNILPYTLDSAQTKIIFTLHSFNSFILAAVCNN